MPDPNERHPLAPHQGTGVHPTPKGTLMAKSTQAPTSLDDLERRVEQGFDVADGGPDGYTPGKNANKYDLTELRGIQSFDDAVALVKEKMGAEAVAEGADVLGNGFTVLPTSQKGKLVDTRFVILWVDFNQGDQGPFVSFGVVTEDGRKFIVNDGSTGIYKQLDDWYGRSEYPGGLLVNGLRESRYIHPIHGAASTFYLNV